MVDFFGRRAQTQERLTKQIAEHLQTQLKPRGVGVVIEAEHTCMSLRGARAPAPGRSPRRCSGRCARTPPPAPSSWPSPVTAGRRDLRLRSAAPQAGCRPFPFTYLRPPGPKSRPASLRSERPAGFVALYALAYIGAILLFLAPLLVSLSLKVNALVGTDRAPNSLSLVAGTGAFLAMFANPFFGKMSDRTTSRLGMRRPWMVIGLLGGSVGILVVALAPNIRVVLVGWCIAQVFFNALLAALVAVLPDQVPVAQRGRVAGVLGICLPIASVSGTYVVQLFTGNTLAMFLAPCAIGGFFILLFAATLKDRRLAVADKPAWSLREFASAFYVTHGGTPTSRGPSPAASCSCWPTPS